MVEAIKPLNSPRPLTLESPALSALPHAVPARDIDLSVASGRETNNIIEAERSSLTSILTVMHSAL